ncbi:MAG: hypothetical protein M3332_06415 [Actinomycetota bacterium]|nr:hypothetical protein [Actinomycetota bacterium]
MREDRAAQPYQAGPRSPECLDATLRELDVVVDPEERDALVMAPRVA